MDLAAESRSNWHLAALSAFPVALRGTKIESGAPNCCRMKQAMSVDGVSRRPGRPNHCCGFADRLPLPRSMHRLRRPKAPVAQLDRAPDYESGGREFESCPVRHFTRCPVL